ncbi:MAG TPA: hypothetical protein VGV18_10515, partial [Verrucomicrobiae bacterium]|nr:hypothetical protein [Verrucomicrobiae bacterium]
MRNIAVSLVSIAALTACVANGQGFTNFGFESAEIVAVSTNANGSVNVATGNAIPGWTAFVGTSQLSVIAYDTPTSVTWPAVGLLGGPQAPAIEGNFDVGLFENGSITQTGLVPAASESLLFGVSFGGSQPFVVSLDGQDLSYIALSNEVNSSGVGYTIYGADVSGY